MAVLGRANNAPTIAGTARPICRQASLCRHCSGVPCSSYPLLDSADQIDAHTHNPVLTLQVLHHAVKTRYEPAVSADQVGVQPVPESRAELEGEMEHHLDDAVAALVEQHADGEIRWPGRVSRGRARRWWTAI